MRFLTLVLLCMQWAVCFPQSCCCVGVGGNYSILPNISKHLVGVRYTHRAWMAKTSSINPELNGRTTLQYMNGTELLARFNLWQRLQLTATIPYLFVHQNAEGTINRSHGLGDISVRLRYQLLDPNKCNGRVSKHQLIVEGGAKFPTGQFDIRKDGSFNTPLQLGTGSVDVLFSTTYTYRYNNWGTNLSTAYKLNTTNNKEYRFGDLAQASAGLFYLKELHGFSLMPAIGLRYEHAFNNVFKKHLLDYTGGDFLFATAGFDFYYRQFAITTAIAPALWNRLNWDGEYKNRFSIEAGAFYNF